MDIHGTGVAKVVKAPNLVQQLVSGIYPVGRGGQIEQQLHLLGRNIHLLLVDQQFKGIHINDQLVEKQLPLLLLSGHTGSTAKHCFDPCQNLLHFEGFCDVIVSTQLQTVDLVIGFALGGEHDHRCLAFAADRSANTPAIHDRHHHIQQNQIRLDGAEFAQTLTAVVGHGNGIAFLFQI